MYLSEQEVVTIKDTKIVSKGFTTSLYEIFLMKTRYT